MVTWCFFFFFLTKPAFQKSNYIEMIEGEFMGKCSPAPSCSKAD